MPRRALLLLVTSCLTIVATTGCSRGTREVRPDPIVLPEPSTSASTGPKVPQPIPDAMPPPLGELIAPDVRDDTPENGMKPSRTSVKLFADEQALYWVVTRSTTGLVPQHGDSGFERAHEGVGGIVEVPFEQDDLRGRVLGIDHARVVEFRFGFASASSLAVTTRGAATPRSYSLSDLSYPSGIDVDGADVFLLLSSEPKRTRIVHVDVARGVVTNTGWIAGPADQFAVLVVGAHDVYYCSTASLPVSVYRRPRSGGTHVELGHDLGYACDGLAELGGDLLFCGETLLRFRRGVATPDVLDTKCDNLAADATGAIWTSGDAVRTLDPTVGASPHLLATAPLDDLTLSPHWIYFTQGRDLRRLPR